MDTLAAGKAPAQWCGWITHRRIQDSISPEASTPLWAPQSPLRASNTPYAQTPPTQASTAEATERHPVIPVPASSDPGASRLCFRDFNFRKITIFLRNCFHMQTLSPLIMHMLFQMSFGTYPLYHPMLCYSCRVQTAVLFKKTPIHPKMKCILQYYLQNTRNVLHPVSPGPFNIHMHNLQPFPLTSIEKQHRKMLLIKNIQAKAVISRGRGKGR